MTLLYATLLPPRNVYNHFLDFLLSENKKTAILLAILEPFLKSFQENHSLSTAVSCLLGRSNEEISFSSWEI